MSLGLRDGSKAYKGPVRVRRGERTLRKLRKEHYQKLVDIVSCELWTSQCNLEGHTTTTRTASREIEAVIGIRTAAEPCSKTGVGRSHDFSRRVAEPVVGIKRIGGQNDIVHSRPTLQLERPSRREFEGRFRRVWSHYVL